MLNKWKG